MALQKAPRLHVPHKFVGQSKQHTPDPAAAVQSIVQGENVTAFELQEVLKKLFREQTDPNRQNWLELERWANEVQFNDTTGGGGGIPTVQGTGKWRVDGGWSTDTSTWGDLFHVPAGQAVLLTWTPTAVGMGGWLQNAALGDANHNRAYITLPTPPSPTLTSVLVTLVVTPMSGGTLNGLHVEVPSGYITGASPPDQWSIYTVAPITIGSTVYCMWTGFWMGWWPGDISVYTWNCSVHIQGSGNMNVGGSPYSGGSFVVMTRY